MEMDGMVQDGDLDDFILPLPRSRIMRRIQDRTERIRGQMSAISGTCSTCTSSVTDDRSSIPFQERFAAFRNEGRRHIKIRSKRRGRPTANLKLRITCLSGPGTTKISGMKIAKLTKIGLGCSSKTAHNIPLEWKEEDFKNFIRSQFPPLGCIKFTFWKLENRELVPIPEGIDTPIQLKDWGNMKRSALYIVPETHLSSPCENENGTCSYVDAGTPTVQFRMSENMLGLNTDAFVSPLENISLASEGITEMDTAINDFIPEVPPTTESSTTSSLSVDSIKDFIEGHRLDFINMNSEDPILLEVRRDHVLMDALAVMRFSQSDLHNPFQIKFCGEQGVDIGGLRREFWSLFLYQFSHSAFVTGKPGRLTFQSNFLEKKKKTFFYLGQLVAMSALQDGPGAPIFSEIVTDFILNEQTTLFEADDLMDHVKEHLQTMETCSSETDLQQHFSNLSDIATDAGFLVPITKFTKQHLSTLKACLVENQVVSCREELEQFIEGLNIHQFLGALRQDEWRSRARVLFSGKVKPVTAATVRSLLNFKFTEGRERPLQMETGQSFLTFLQATKVSEAKVNGIEIKPRDVLMWLTGATNIPACGFHKAIDVDFGTITSVNTCALCCTLEVKKHNTPEDAVLYFSELLINSQTFSKE